MLLCRMKTCGRSRRWRTERLTMARPTKIPQTAVQAGFEVASFTSYRLHSCMGFFFLCKLSAFKSILLRIVLWICSAVCETTLPECESSVQYLSARVDETIDFHFPPGGDGGFKIGFIVVLVLLILVIIAVIAFCVWQRKRPQYSEVHKGAEPAWCKCAVLYFTFYVFEVTCSFFMATSTPWVGELATAALRASAVSGFALKNPRLKMSAAVPLLLFCSPLNPSAWCSINSNPSHW